MSSTLLQHDQRARAMIGTDRHPRRHGSPSLSPKSLPKQLSKDMPSEILNSSSGDDEPEVSPTIPVTPHKGKQRGLHGDHNAHQQVPKSATHGSKQIKRGEGGLKSHHVRSRSVLDPVQPDSPLTPQSSKSQKHTSLQSPTSRFYDTPASLRVEDAVRQISSRGDEGDSSSRSKDKSSCSSNSRLQRILMERGLDDIDTSSTPSTGYSSAKSTGISMAMSSAPSSGDFPRRSMQETMHRLSLVLPAIPSDDEEPTPFSKRRSITSTSAAAPRVAKPVQRDAETVAKLRSWSTTTYVPGRIKIDRTFGLYAIPIMTAMDVLCSSEAVNDEQVVDDMTDFFASFGLEPMVNTIDMFWKTSDLPLSVSASSARISSTKYTQSSSKRASRHSPMNSQSGNLLDPNLSPNPSGRAQNFEGNLPSPTYPRDSSRLSISQQGAGSAERPVSSKGSQHTSANARSSSRISPRWVMEHRDPTATAFLAVPSGTPSAVQQAILNKPSRPPISRSSTQPGPVMQHIVIQQSNAEDSLSPTSPGTSLQRRASGAAGSSGYQQSSGKSRFSIRKMLGRSHIDKV